eukprot:CAMPEP_0179922644 /NCGR_PEP_ID=MMETSP0983-20121128/5765_1 /TAXON_ID=483367 /ORGANISM="non described non described, Strain CCMP 2436" /LENGTH=52 /DNA_ID=CAMNT_0021826037 /DNA_START=436 /DNA_END=591 /DNA_ORIENTATION=+
MVLVAACAGVRRHREGGEDEAHGGEERKSCRIRRRTIGCRATRPTLRDGEVA